MFVVSFFEKCFAWKLNPLRLPTSNGNCLVSKNSEDLIDQRCQNVLISASRLKSSSLTQYKQRIKTKIYHIAKRRRKSETDGIRRKYRKFSDFFVRFRNATWSAEILKRVFTKTKYFIAEFLQEIWYYSIKSSKYLRKYLRRVYFVGRAFRFNTLMNFNRLIENWNCSSTHQTDGFIGQVAQACSFTCSSTTCYTTGWPIWPIENGFSEPILIKVMWSSGYIERLKKLDLPSGSAVVVGGSVIIGPGVSVCVDAVLDVVGAGAAVGYIVS